jgi:hypothetical protein
MNFESHEVPDNGDLVSFLRGVGTQPFLEPRGDVGDRSPLDWVGRLYNAHPEWRDRIDDAYSMLLTAEDPLPYRVLEQVSKHHDRSFLPRLFGVIAAHRTELARRADTSRTDGRSLLGSFVHAAAMMQKTVRPSVDAARVLAAIDRPEDGWPYSFLLALPGDVDGLLPRVTSILQRLDDADLKVFVDGMLADGPPWTEVALDEIGRGPTALRDRIAQVIHRATEEMEKSRGGLAMLDFDDDPELQALVRAAAQKPNPWPGYAARLGVDASK